jgi:hypothetical protein
MQCVGAAAVGLSLQHRLISHEEANAWREEVWPIEPDEDDLEDVA